MSSPTNGLRWDKERGSLHLARGGAEQRVFMMRKGFMDSFFEEIENVEGKDALSMTVRMILEKIGATPTTPHGPPSIPSTASRTARVSRFPSAPTSSRPCSPAPGTPGSSSPSGPWSTCWR